MVDKGVVLTHAIILQAISDYGNSYKDQFTLVSPPIPFSGGEAVKNGIDPVLQLHEMFNHYGLDRHSVVTGVGGGAFLDVVGLAASTAHRGIRHIRIPTTVVSQGDGGVGIKNGINAFGKKNFVGTFAPPLAVLNDANFLTTLNNSDWFGGISEAIKVGLLKDPRFFEWIETKVDALKKRDLETMAELVYHSAGFHTTHIAQSGDPFEMGSSRPLDFGHWAAHKLEQMTDFKLRHGEAVAIGICLDVTYSKLIGLLSESDRERIIILFKSLNLPTFHSKLKTWDIQDRPEANILTGLDDFQEHLGGQLALFLLKGIGNPLEVNEFDREKMIEAIKILEKT